ncbi:DUF5719 family protein [Kitasatospora sp. NPDC094015]|uniref:DUF5719 family protein n=1 Tax=Kitasatospora sp. NPDC094015 TaxID=3155205 RepID=UPI00332A092D
MKKPSIKAPKLKAPALKKPEFAAAGLGGASRTGRSLLAAGVVLGVVFGIAELRPPVTPAAAGTAAGATTAQVERTSVVCPQPLQGVTGSTALSLFTPPGAAATGGTAALNDVTVESAGSAGAPAPAPSAPASGDPSGAAAPAADAARLTLAKPGAPATGPAANGDLAPGTVAVATGALAPGFTASQVTTVTDPQAIGLSGVGCAPSGTSFWFSGASTLQGRVDYVSLVNAEAGPAVVDLKLYGPKGPIDNDAANGIAVAPGTSDALRLSSLAPGVDDLTVQVRVRSGRVGAGLHAVESGKGADWLQPSVAPAPDVVIPGLPADASATRLVVAAPGQDDADLKVQISGKNGWFTPVDHETLHVKAGMVTAVDLGQVTRGEVGAIRLTPSDPAHPTPVVAGVRVDRAKNGKSDAAWLAGAAPVGTRASLADNRGGGQSQLILTSGGDAEAKVKVTSSAGSGGGNPVSKDLTVPAGATVALDLPDPEGLNGVYGLTVETVSGGPVMAARMLTVPTKDVQMFTIQSLADDHSTVRLPHTEGDPGVLLR